MEEAGAVIGDRYVLEAGLGQGGMAAVYRVRDTRTGKTLALKRGLASDPRKQKKREALLQREYQTLCQLAHPRIIEVYDFGVDQSGPYYVMELLHGSDLGAGGGLAWKEVCLLLRDVASSLAIVHARGLIHRDVSARNVGRTLDGRAKLIDFGAMTSMGVPKDIVGTPPFMAPETLQMQTLDARSDLYSLGALGYYLLTGRHAYPARRMSELRDAWRSRPRSPRARVAEIPTALSELVLQLLALDRNARPQNAAEVISRLSVIGELALEEQSAVSHAYLTTPKMVGRERALVVVRKRLLSLARGDGGTLWIEGVAGSGRSRLLDACVIEGKLAGAAVLRADEGDAERGDFGVMRRLCAQLIELMPTQATEAAHLSHHLRAHVLDEALADDLASTSSVAPERSVLIRELRDFVLALSRDQRLLIAVDDFERIDEPSMAVLAALASKTERYPLILALAIDRGSKANDLTSPAFRLLRSVSDRIELEQLSSEQTEDLMGSVFGDVPNLRVIAGRIYALAQGNLRETMELAQHLVSERLVRYQDGRFSLPDTLDDKVLPKTLAVSLQARLDALPADARELCDVLCLMDGSALTLASYPRLTAHHDPKRVFAALDQLLAARVLVADAELYRFSQRGFLSVVASTMPEARAREVHARIADLLASMGADTRLRAHHLFESGRDAEAIELICSSDLKQRFASLSLLQRAVESAARHDFDALTTHRLRMALLIEASTVPAIDCFRAHVQPVLVQLERDSSLALYRELEGLPPAERLTQALAKTQEAHLATSPHARVYSVADAIPELASLAAVFSGIGIWTFDLDFLETFPSLEPLVPLSPALGVLTRFCEAGREWVRGRFSAAAEIYKQLIARIAEPDRAGLRETQHDRIRVGLHLLLGLLTASSGYDVAEAHADVLEQDARFRVSAWRVRQVLHLSRGNNEEARRCMRRAEVLQLQVGGEQHGIGSTFAIELVVATLAGDVLALRTAVEQVARLAEHHQGWRPVLIYGESQLRQLQGDAPGALELLLPAFDLARPNRHWCYGWLAAAQVGLLTELDRVEEAIDVGRRHVEVCDREGLLSSDQTLRVALALSLTRAGRADEAIPLIESAVASLEAPGRSGIVLGVAYEARARIALATDDTFAFEHAAKCCAREFGRGKSATLAARFSRLMEDANRINGSSVRPSLPPNLLSEEVSNTQYATVHSRMRECLNASDRARCALTILLQHVESFAGYLYGFHEDGVTLLTGLPEGTPEPEVDAWARRWTHAQLGSLARKPTSAEHDGSPAPAKVPNRHVDGEGRVFEAVLLLESAPEKDSVAAVLVLQVPDEGQWVPYDRRLLSCMAAELLARGDVAGIALEQTGTVTDTEET